ncbi:DUF4350 domain-containing protein [Nocardioides sp.]|uniref:DUF4350 domain-containing protein n=1 Tax=Nocardioides sp. TaxID=35761 RepID=UPI003D0C38C7
MTSFLRQRSSLLILGGLVLAVLLSAWLSAGDQRSGALDPQNNGPDGAQALAQVLGDQGVEVDVVRDADALDDADTTGATVLVTSTQDLGRSTARRLVSATSAANLIVVDPAADLVDLLGRQDAEPTPYLPDGPLAAQCADTRLTGLELEVDLATSYAPVDAGCFAATDGGVVFAPQEDRLAFFGAGGALSNDQITRADNAAVALRLLGSTDRLVWYVPDLADLQAGDEVGVGSLLPRWLTPALWLTGLTILALALWRGRRLGALVREPLPVVVKAIETTESRARLYRKARDRRHAAAALRSAAQRRAATRLGLARGTDEAQVISEIARHTGHAEADIARVLSQLAQAPTTDTELNTLARQLASLDERLREAPR